MIRKQIRAALFWATEQTWAAAFRLLGWVHQPRVERWQAAGGQRILVIAPHPDDETIGCGGTMILHQQGGDEVYLAVVTDGRQSRALGLAAEEMVERRRHEVADAADILGVDEVAWCALPEGAWETAIGQQTLRTLLERIRPHIVYAPSRIDFHPEHYKVAHAFTLALKTYIHPLTVRVYPIQVPLTATLTNLVTDTSPVAHNVMRALIAYETQLGSLMGATRRHHYAARRYRLPTTAEAFWQLSAIEYGQLHEEAPDAWSSEFRGMRARPFSDPLAYLSGQRTRRAYRSASARRFNQNLK